ncbi:MAG: response regulator transcription factor [Chitinophagaceae bacterium]
MIAYADRIIEKSLSMQEEKIRIIVVDDHSVVREFLQLILNANERFSVIKACDNGIDAIEQAALLQPDLMLLDINMSPLNGFEVAQKALEQNHL